MASSAAISNMFVIFKTIWPNRELDKNMIRFYSIFLEDIDDEDLIVAAVNCGETCEFWPVPAEIRKRTKVGMLSPEQAFSLAMTTYSERELPPAVLLAVKNLGGLQFMKEQPHYVIRRHFLDAYKDLSIIHEREESRERYKALLPQLEKTIKLLEAGDD